MGSVGGAIVGPLVGGLAGKMFGGSKGSDAGDYAAAPTQTPDQTELSAFVKPYLTGWMKEPPKLQTSPLSQTKITVGGNNLSGSMFPSASQSQSSSVGGANALNPFSMMPGFDSFSKMFSSPTQSATQQNQNSQQTQTTKSPYGDLASKLTANSSAWSPETQQIYSAVPGAQQSGFFANGRYFGAKGGGRAGMAETGNYQQTGAPYIDPVTKQAVVKVSHASGQLPDKIVPYLGDVAGVQSGGQGAEETKYGFQGAQGLNGYSPNVSTSQSQNWLNIPNIPGLTSTYGAEGGFQNNTNWMDAISSLANPLNYTDQIKNLSRPFDQTGMINEAFAPITDRSAEIAKIGQAINLDPNSLEQLSEQKIREGMERKLQEGYTADYLKELTAAGVDPLKDAYDEALKQAGEDYNRMNMKASGFEFGKKFGQESDSITTNYLKNIADVARDVSLRGAEAAREDRFRNASLQDSMVDRGVSLSGRQQDQQLQIEQLNRQYAAQGYDLAQRQELIARDLAQGKLQAFTDQDVRNRALEEGSLDRLMQQDLTNKDLLGKSIQMGSQQDQSNEANRQWWAGMRDDQKRYDQQSEQSNWQNQLGLAQWLSGREDDLTKYNQGLDLELQKSNIGYQQDALNAILSFISGQNPIASNMQSNYWNAQNMAANNQAQDNAAISQIAKAFSNGFGNSNKNPVVSPASTAGNYMNAIAGLSGIPGTWS
jgi:hypothetical protein